MRMRFRLPGGITVRTKANNRIRPRLTLQHRNTGHNPAACVQQQHLQSAQLIDIGGCLADGLVLSGVPVVADCTHNTYTLFDSSVVEEGSVTVVKKLGWCQVYGYVKLADTVSAMMDILDSTKVPAPQTGVGIYDTAGYWTSSYTRLMRVGVGAGGGLRIMYGAAGTFWFSITYPVA